MGDRGLGVVVAVGLFGHGSLFMIVRIQSKDGAQSKPPGAARKSD
jgi:hypothetical protein